MSELTPEQEIALAEMRETRLVMARGFAAIAVSQIEAAIYARDGRQIAADEFKFRLDFMIGAIAPAPDPVGIDPANWPSYKPGDIKPRSKPKQSSIDGIPVEDMGDDFVRFVANGTTMTWPFLFAVSSADEVGVHFYPPAPEDRRYIVNLFRQNGGAVRFDEVPPAGTDFMIYRKTKQQAEPGGATEPEDFEQPVTQCLGDGIADTFQLAFGVPEGWRITVEFVKAETNEDWPLEDIPEWKWDGPGIGPRYVRLRKPLPMGCTMIVRRHRAEQLSMNTEPYDSKEDARRSYDAYLAHKRAEVGDGE